MSIIDARLSVRFWLDDEGSGSPITYTFDDPGIDRFLTLAEVPDINGLPPLQTGWIPTWDVRRAAGWGWIKKGQLIAKPLMYKVGDVQVTYDKAYCQSRARELMGSSSAPATRVDEPYPEQRRKKFYDGDPGMES